MGGKAACLGELLRAGFPVPDGFVVGISEGSEDVLLLRPPKTGENRDWDVLLVQMPLDGTMTVLPTIQRFVTERIEGMLERHESQLAGVETAQGQVTCDAVVLAIAD